MFELLWLFWVCFVHMQIALGCVGFVGFRWFVVLLLGFGGFVFMFCLMLLLCCCVFGLLFCCGYGFLGFVIV